MILLNGKEINITIFPDKTSQVWRIEEQGKYIDEIEFCFHAESEIFHLVQLCDLLKSQARKYSLYMPYLPYGRQDKCINNEFTFALHSFSSVLNMLDFLKVTSLDVHSNEAEKLINNFRSIYPLKGITSAVLDGGADVVAFPDTGAFCRYKNPLKTDPILGVKERDPLTGHITNYSFRGDPRNKKVLIIDDICDGGMTFKLFAEQLLDKGALEVHLYTTHGIYSKGIKTLRDSGITKIFDKIGESI